MRRVVYYFSGIVADFHIPDELYIGFAERAASIPGDHNEELEKARKVLERLMRKVADDEDARAGENEAIAACFIWHHLNHVIEDEGRIDGDILIADQAGDGEDVAYMPLADVDLVEDDGGEA